MTKGVTFFPFLLTNDREFGLLKFGVFARSLVSVFRKLIFKNCIVEELIAKGILPRF